MVLRFVDDDERRPRHRRPENTSVSELHRSAESGRTIGAEPHIHPEEDRA